MTDYPTEEMHMALVPETWVLPEDKAKRLDLLEQVIRSYGYAQERQNKAQRMWQAARGGDAEMHMQADAFVNDARSGVYRAAANLIGIHKVLKAEFEAYTDDLRDKVSKSPGGVEYEAARNGAEAP